MIHTKWYGVVESPTSMARPVWENSEAPITPFSNHGEIPRSCSQSSSPTPMHPIYHLNRGLCCTNFIINLHPRCVVFILNNSLFHLSWSWWITLTISVQLERTLLQRIRGSRGIFWVGFISQKCIGLWDLRTKCRFPELLLAYIRTGEHGIGYYILNRDGLIRRSFSSPNMADLLTGLSWSAVETNHCNYRRWTRATHRLTITTGK